VATLIRPYLTFAGSVRFIPYEICRCGTRNGLMGGFCGCCGDAIPNRTEQVRLNRMEDSDDVRPQIRSQQETG